MVESSSAAVASAISSNSNSCESSPSKDSTVSAAERSKRQWKYQEKQKLRQVLSPLQYHITQEKGTEKPHSGAYVKLFETGNYTCVVCGQRVFSSEHKYPSHCGWATFYNTADQASINTGSTNGSGIQSSESLSGNTGSCVERAIDTFDGLVRMEVKCSKCGAHLGHVFDDGPKKYGGERYCVNSAALKFIPSSQVNTQTQ
ncbi:peptide methionine sulfoxide reductase MsrB-like [Convolutriloba macropyga]|uniref:peptide methionine sulfoxide reductase MsrB-like n=1 Tax=Convolutriloba macropyga TaxID=536237 RepID=UPI003F5273CB